MLKSELWAVGQWGNDPNRPQARRKPHAFKWKMTFSLKAHCDKSVGQIHPQFSTYFCGHIKTTVQSRSLRRFCRGELNPHKSVIMG